MGFPGVAHGYETGVRSSGKCHGHDYLLWVAGGALPEFVKAACRSHRKSVRKPVAGPSRVGVAPVSQAGAGTWSGDRRGVRLGRDPGGVREG